MEKDNRYYYYILLENKEVKLVYGYQIPNGLAINRDYSGEGFVVTDIKSGSNVFGVKFKTQKEALAHIKEEGFESALEENRSKDNYLKKVNYLKSKVEEIPVEDRCPGWKRYFK